ncbi:MAG: hypothetical protein U0360_11305 [Dehalococcoidia bacterium]
MHLSIYQAISTMVAIVALTIGLVSQQLEARRARAPAPASSIPRWQVPQPWPSTPSSATESYLIASP